MVSFKKRKWLLNGSDNPHSSLISNPLESLNHVKHSKSFKNFMFIGDFKVPVNHNSKQTFVIQIVLKTLLMFQHVI